MSSAPLLSSIQWGKHKERRAIETLPLLALVLVFAGAAAMVWVAGIWLSDTTDVLASRFHLGEAMGGIILLAVTTNLPEIAITTSAALRHEIGLAVGNLIGGIALQTVVLAALDGMLRGPRPLTYRAASLALVLEAGLVVVVLTIAVMGTRLPDTVVFARMTPQNLLILAAWAGGLWLQRRAARGLPWKDSGSAPNSQELPRGGSQSVKDRQAREQRVSTGRTVALFALAAAMTLAGGVLMELSGEGLAACFGMTGVLFGATVLAAATSLPELSTGLTSIRLGDYQLAMDDILGGNAFLPTLFLLASLISGEAVLPHAQNSDVYLAGLGILLTVIYIYGLIFRPSRRWWRLGLDSWAVVIAYLIGIAGLALIR